MQAQIKDCRVAAFPNPNPSSNPSRGQSIKVRILELRLTGAFGVLKRRGMDWVRVVRVRIFSAYGS